METRAMIAGDLSFRVLGSLRVDDGHTDRSPAGTLQRRLLKVPIADGWGLHQR